LTDLRRMLTPTGTLVMVAPGSGDWLGPITRIVAAKVRSRMSGQTLMTFLASVTKDDLRYLKDLIEAGKVRPVIDRTYPLSETAEAIRRVEEGRAAGKVVITI
jgi:NADPH:quinone reductase-like Zn-dependent oxidoreductase